MVKPFLNAALYWLSLGVTVSFVASLSLLLTALTSSMESRKETGHELNMKSSPLVT